MSDYIDLYIKCWTCQGTGSVPPTTGGGEGNCPQCHGAGKLFNGYLDVTDILDLLNDIKDRAEDILEKVNE